MRISDWSSDVCSSDLILQRGLPRHQRIGLEQVAGPAVQAAKCRAVDLDAAGRRLQQAGGGIEQRRLAAAGRPDAGAEFARRSEERRVGTGGVRSVVTRLSTYT